MMELKAMYDFRSDTVTKPTKAMREAMLVAEVGDEVYEEDPTVRMLETHVANLCGKEAALFVVSGVMSNQLAMRTHLSSPMLSVICDKRSHLFRYECGGVAYHSQGTLVPLDPPTGKTHITAAQCAAEIVPEDIHYSPTRVISLENTLGGCIFPLQEMQKIRSVADQHGILMHLDGARLWNASVATGYSLQDYCSLFDSVSLCLSKGLGAPIGSVLVGRREFIEKARKYRKLFGGGWRQAGILAAGGLFAIEHHWKRMVDDHANARHLANGLTNLGFQLTQPVETNMVFVDLAPLNAVALSQRLKKDHDIVANSEDGTTIFRFVIHLQTPRESIDLLLHGVKAAMMDIHLNTTPTA